MLQLKLKEGLKQFGKHGEESTIKEMKQLHDLHTFPRDMDSLIKKEQIKALLSLILFKEKQSMEVKS